MSNSKKKRGISRIYGEVGAVIIMVCDYVENSNKNFMLSNQQEEITSRSLLSVTFSCSMFKVAVLKRIFNFFVFLILIQMQINCQNSYLLHPQDLFFLSWRLHFYSMRRKNFPRPTHVRQLRTLQKIVNKQLILDIYNFHDLTTITFISDSTQN